MRILVLTKRQYTGKDLLAERYGRIFEIPAALSRRGHDVRGIALSYRNRGQEDFAWPDLPGMRWRSVDACPQGILRYARVLDDWTEDWRPDVIWASSDMPHAVLAERWARTRQVPLVLDLYDNYESFGLSKLPGLKAAFRRACRRAQALTVVSHALNGYVSSSYALSCPVTVLQNGVRLDLFQPRDKRASRVAIGLPVEARVIGTVGAISSGRGIEMMFEAFMEMADSDPELWLVHAGPVDAAIAKRYRHPRIRDLGVQPTDQVPQILASLDVAIICNRDSDFGRYCFPLKLHEILAMKIPFVAAAVGDVVEVMSPYQQLLFTPGDVTQLQSRIAMQLRDPLVPGLKAPGWDDCADSLEKVLKEAM